MKYTTNFNLRKPETNETVDVADLNYNADQIDAALAAHKSRHASGGADALTPADIGAAAASHTHSGGDITSAVANATNADTVDGAHAGTGANNVLKLDSSGQVPLGNIPSTLTGKSADQVDGYHAGNSSGQVPVSNGTVCTNLNADKVDGLDVTGSGTAGLRKIYISTSDPSGGADGEVWLKYA